MELEGDTLRDPEGAAEGARLGGDDDTLAEKLGEADPLGSTHGYDDSSITSFRPSDTTKTPPSAITKDRASSSAEDTVIVCELDRYTAS